MFRLTLCLSLLVVAVGHACAQTDPVQSAKAYVVERMREDWKSEVKVDWGSAGMTTVGDEVTVIGYGLAHRAEDALDAVFLYEVRMNTIRRIAPRVNYSILRWSNQALNDSYYVQASRALVKLKAGASSATQLDFAPPTIARPTATVCTVAGTGTYSAGPMWSGTFRYEVRFDATTGAILWDQAQFVPSQSGANWESKARSEEIAQAYAADYVRKHEGSQVHVQFTGPVSQLVQADGTRRVDGRAQWRRGDGFSWNSFQYSLVVDLKQAKVTAGTVTLASDNHGASEDRKFILIAQDAARRRFAEQSAADVTFLTARASALPFGKRRVVGEFSARGKRYQYDVVIEVATNRVEKVDIRSDR